MDLTFGTPLSQSGRLLQLTTPLGADQLQALRAHDVERIGRTPRYTLDVLVQDTEYDPEKLIGQPVSLVLLCDDGSQAPRHGLVEVRNTTGNYSNRPPIDTTPHLKLTADNQANYVILKNLATAGKVAYQPLQGPAVIGADYSGDAYRASMASPDDTGDGTVPTHSADALTKFVKFSAKLKGFDHSHSYDNKTVRAVTLHSIISPSKDAKNLCQP